MAIRIKRVSARPILDSRGDWTIEALIEFRGMPAVTASVPQGKSAGSHEAVALPAQKAVRNITRIISPALAGKEVKNPDAIDALLCAIDGTRTKRRLGGNAMLAVSIAAWRAAAQERKIPFWKYIRKEVKLGGPSMPRLFMNVINGGLHAGNNLAFQEYLIIPKTNSIHKSVAMGSAFYHALGRYLSRTSGAVPRGDEGGYAPNFKNAAEPFRAIKHVAAQLRLTEKLEYGLDAAGNVAVMSKKNLFAVYRALAKSTPLFYLEDPFGEEAFLEFAALRKKLGKRVNVAGDDLTVTNVRRLEAAHGNQSVSAVIIKPNQIGTVSEAIKAVRYTRQCRWMVVVSHRSGETNDDFIADFAIGVRADGLKLGAPARGERIAKFNRLLEIEKEMR